MNDETRLDELLAERATQGLSDLDSAALDVLVESEPDIDVDHYDGAAAALDLTLNARFYVDAEPMPAELARRLDALADELASGRSVDEWCSAADEPPAGAPEPARAAASRPQTQTHAPRSSLWGLAGWLVAAAAIAVMASGLFDVATPEPGEPTVASVDAFLERHPDAIEVDWGPGGDPTGSDAKGRVVWSQSAQAGFMVFDDLAVNDARVEQYQLWIFDDARDHPVDGGVFDVRDASGEVVPITAKLPVTTPTLFAVTVERPGGVVVSSKERISLAADPGRAR